MIRARIRTRTYQEIRDFRFRVELCRYRHGNELVAYYTTGGSDLRAEDVAAAMSRFPTEIIPKDFARLAAMPITPSNKIDRKRLAERRKPADERA